MPPGAQSMFENLKGMASMAGLLKELPKLKAKLDEVKTRLGDRRVEAQSGGGAVRVTANGLLRVVSIDFDQAAQAQGRVLTSSSLALSLGSLLDVSNPDDCAVACELIVGAVNAALASARELAEQEMADAAGELGLPLPPRGTGGVDFVSPGGMPGIPPT